MASVGGYYLNPHRSQYDPDSSTFTRQTGCGPTTVANGANASTGGHISKTAQQVHDLIPRSQETDPSTPGWSIPDQDRAAAKLGVPFENRSGQGWGKALTALAQGLYVALQGDSDQFGNETCSGAFNGDHDIGIHPATRVVDGLRQHWIDDPICPTGRWEFDYIIRKYAVKLSASVRFAVFTRPVPKVAVPKPPTVTLRAGATRVTPPRSKRISVGVGHSAVIRRGPTRASASAGTIPNGKVSFTLYQVTKKGQLLAGSRTWYGDAAGTRWLHSSSF